VTFRGGRTAVAVVAASLLGTGAWATAVGAQAVQDTATAGNATAPAATATEVTAPVRIAQVAQRPDAGTAPQTPPNAAATAVTAPVQVAQVAQRPENGAGPESPPAEVPIEKQPPPKMSPQASPTQIEVGSFGPDPNYSDLKYNVADQLAIYGGKHAVIAPRPLLELGPDLYAAGPIGDGINLFGNKDRLFPQFEIFGDWRTAYGYSNNGNKKENSEIATRINLDVDLKLTATERIHAFFQPLQQNGAFTRTEFGGAGHAQSQFLHNGNVKDLFFEGDIGAITAGITDNYQSFDMPVAAGFVPLLFQNGVWMNDAVIGGAVTVPSRNVKQLDITNMDITFFGAGDKVTTKALVNKDGSFADDAGRLFGVASFIETLSGYIEADYGYVQDTRPGPTNFSYNNASLAFTKRYFDTISNSVRVVWNFGQNPGQNAPKTADGAILLLENSLITDNEQLFVPYLNGWIGGSHPQSLARDAAQGGILLNTGINFETDNLVNFPKLDDTGEHTFGGALGVEYLFDLHQQIVFELATVQVIGGPDKVGRPAKGDEYGVGVRYQLPLNDRWILRADAMAAHRDDDDPLLGVRFEIRRKF